MSTYVDVEFDKLVMAFRYRFKHLMKKGVKFTVIHYGILTKLQLISWQCIDEERIHVSSTKWSKQKENKNETKIKQS